ncbi:hypothetical protein BDV23DRAFT_184017 [Aspergillus alliaceus]|uniref:Lipoyl-binding domain-containing protein n=1 Tax=Petromyces alliaceus TaxID=209559 RepID=A0A5N7C741_PETAA|nr:hypothetical protein BDV23DRAFT_184017 [Aspergillus alliaceus]
MAESISEGVLSIFNKQAGDHVEQDEKIASIETDMIDVAVNAPHTGTVTKLLVSEGDTVTFGQPVVEISLQTRDTPYDTRSHRIRTKLLNHPRRLVHNDDILQGSAATYIDMMHSS